MKKPLGIRKACLLTVLAVFGLLGNAALSAQNVVAKAKYDKAAKAIMLDESAPFGYLFQLDITPMGFDSKAKATEFFSNLDTELVTFRVNFEKRSAEVLLKIRSKPEWRAKEWNAYLATLPKP